LHKKYNTFIENIIHNTQSHEFYREAIFNVVNENIVDVFKAM